MNEEQTNGNYTSRLTIGRGKYYINIGTVYLATMTKPTDEQIVNLREQLGIEVLTEEEWENIPTADVDEDEDVQS